MASSDTESSPELIDPFGGPEGELDPDIYPDPTADDPPFGDEPVDGDARFRAQLLRSTFEWSPIEDVTLAVSMASGEESEVYVERLGDQYRWSLVHRGGPYPLLRIAARFLRVDHRSIVIGFKNVDDGYSALSDDREIDVIPDATAVLRFDRPVTPRIASEHIRGSLNRED